MRKYTYKGSGFFNMCTGKKCAAESPMKTVINPMMKNVIKKVNSVINNNNNNNDNVTKAIKSISKTIEKFEKFKNTLTNNNNISLKADQIKTLKALREALITKDPSKVNKNFEKNVRNRTLKKMKGKLNNN